ncbi:MAG: stage II sporulation protein M [Microthrixaceae bacterium]|nr:stage II sporulation protein M [Microthrixaceae bacterium]
MDIDRFIAENQASWNRLDQLVAKGSRSVRRLSSDELDDLLALYQTTSGHLSTARTQFDDIGLSNRLSRTLGNARGLIYRKKGRTGVAAARFFTETFPAAAWMCRRAIAAAAFLLFAPALALGIWLNVSGEARNAAIDPETQKLVAASEFEEYYKSEAAEAWAFELLTHNIQVSVMAYGGGALGGVGGVYLLATNGANLGVMAAVMHTHGKGPLFWGLILPHGLLELTAIAVASGAGLRIAWAMFVPGDRTRGQAVAEEGLRSVTVLLGTMVLFVVAGFTEAFVTPSDLPTAARVGIGVVVELLALTWMFGVGRNAATIGLTGKFGEPPMADLVAAHEQAVAAERAGAAQELAAHNRPVDFTLM